MWSNKQTNPHSLLIAPDLQTRCVTDMCPLTDMTP